MVLQVIYEARQTGQASTGPAGTRAGKEQASRVVDAVRLQCVARATDTDGGLAQATGVVEAAVEDVGWPDLACAVEGGVSLECRW